MAIDPKSPEPVDLHVGMTVRARRRALGLSQEDLGVALAVTAQQIQKYESAASRMSASKLFAAARALNVRVSYFFAAIDERETDPLLLGLDEDISPFLECPEAMELAAFFPQITDAAVRQNFVGLARAMAEAGAAADLSET